MTSLQPANGAYQIRTMTRGELAMVVEWAAAEGWNPGLYDVECFYAADPSGFLIGLLNNEPIASISVVKYGTTFGFLGFYIVKLAFRGQGYGWQIWQAGLNYLQNRTIGLDGVLEQQNNYTKSGFQLAHQNIRYEGRGRSTDKENLVTQAANVESSEGKQSSGGKLISLSSVPLAAVIEYEKTIFLAERSAFLDCWLNSPRHTVVGWMQNQQLMGYGVLRPCQQGYKIGPLFADSPQIADSIFLALKAHVEPGNPFYIDIPDANAAAVALAQKYQLTSVFETARMYNKSIPELPLNRIFGITTFELG